MLPNLSDHDLKQRYNNTYLHVRYVDQKFVGYVIQIGTELTSFRELGTFPNKELTIIREFPEMGLINFKGSVHIVARRPVRQWSRGYKSDVIQDTCRTPGVRKFHEQLTLQGAEAAFNRVWIPLVEGLNNLANENYASFAVNNKYWFSGNKEHRYLWRNRVCVGELVSNKIFFFKESTLLQEEIKTDLRELYVS